jgi:hypothetical protein
VRALFFVFWKLCPTVPISAHIERRHYSDLLVDAAVIDLLVDDVFWRDMLALTWEFHTFQSTPSAQTFLADQHPLFTLSSFKLREDLVISRGFRLFDFESTGGIAPGVFGLVPLADASCKSHTVFTNLENLKRIPEQNGPRQDLLGALVCWLQGEVWSAYVRARKLQKKASVSVRQCINRICIDYPLKWYCQWTCARL